MLPDLVALARDAFLPWSSTQLLEAARELPSREGIEEEQQGAGAQADPLLELLLEHPEQAAAYLPEECWPVDPVERLAAEMSLPPWLAGRLANEYGEETARRLATCLLEPATLDLRVNLARVTREEALRRLSGEIGHPVSTTPWSPLGLRIGRRLNLAGTAASRSGWIEVEDEGSQVIALAVDSPRSGVIVDACAGAGGKTLALADLVLGPAARRQHAPASPLIVACDVSRSRLDKLTARAAKAGLENLLRIVCIPPEGDLPPSVPEADLILVDAPCSGLGTLRRSPDMKLRHGPEDVDRFRRLQVAILDRWAPRVRRGGRLAYATCSILRAENEEVAETFGASHPEFAVSPSEWALEHLPAGCHRQGFIHIDPLLTQTDGFFLALWRKR